MDGIEEQYTTHFLHLQSERGLRLLLFDNSRHGDKYQPFFLFSSPNNPTKRNNLGERDSPLVLSCAHNISPYNNRPMLACGFCSPSFVC